MRQLLHLSLRDTLKDLQLCQPSKWTSPCGKILMNITEATILRVKKGGEALFLKNDNYDGPPF